MTEKKQIFGSDVKTIQTLKSWNDMDCINFIDNDDCNYRIKVDGFYKLIKNVRFSIERKRKHKYLKIDTSYKRGKNNDKS